MTARSLRETVFADLQALGFRPATSLPMPDVGQSIRPAADVASRLLALDALFTWVTFPEENAQSPRVRAYLDRNRLLDWLIEDESAILSMPRAEAHEEHLDSIGWKLENMWALAWVLGFEPEPGLEASQIPDDVSRAIVFDFLPGLDGSVDDLLASCSPRSDDEVVAMEYRFYCAHNAVRSAQLGHDTVPPGFHPILHGGAVHERRHSLSWCIDPETPWDETDLST